MGPACVHDRVFFSSLSCCLEKAWRRQGDGHRRMCRHGVIDRIARQTLLSLLFVVFDPVACIAERLPDTQALTWEGDIAARLVDQVDQFLLRELQRSVDRRMSYWPPRDLSSPTAYAESESVRVQRQQLAHMLGMRDERVASPVPTILMPASSHRTKRLPESRLGRGRNFDVFAVQWPAFGRVTGTGLLLVPDKTPIANVVALPDCEVLPEQLVGLTPGVPANQQYARRLAESGCRVIVPMLINRKHGDFDWGARPAPSITNREMLYRSAYELGRGLIAYELQKVLAAIDWLASEAQNPRSLGILGWGEGGLLSLYAGAIDPRLQVVCASGYFESRQSIWKEPIDRNIFGLLEQFGDAELAALIAPRKLVVEAARAPEVELGSRGSSLALGGGAPARITTPSLEVVQSEIERARALVKPLDPHFLTLVASDDGQGHHATDETLNHFLRNLSPQTALAPSGSVQRLRSSTDAQTIHRQQMRELDDHSQNLLRESSLVRQQFMSDLDTSSIEAYRQSVAPYRRLFHNQVIGRFDIDLAFPNPRSRQIYETDEWRGYEVVLDVFENVFAYGILLVPKDLKEGERRPAVVCQHGLEGRPQDTVGVQGSVYYAGFAGALASRGYITFSPQNLYIGKHRFRTLQRKSYPIRKTLFSTIVPQHQQIVNWLKSLGYVDSQRIAFYGLSYGGKTAMRVPPLVTDYCLSICSADFNEWVDKNASTRNPRSYVWSGEYEIFEFNLGSTFNYAEMAALIAPRPFMVERGHFDGVADDWTVAWEFAKVRNLYVAQLKRPSEDCRIEWFDGPHKINGQGTYEFLDRHLRHGATEPPQSDFDARP